ncbi:sulfite exporter TauE/SafE family protein [Oerskovia flava]|uniref:sulfite exporter TauE/SafE family protein n=1 Tax=Oerskovia flava TaxID=2986422 RepID=UPI00223EA8C3|nr:sulfite exporter TauE/SafE family protein [Oerskovia sp. JB1-3-2]
MVILLLALVLLGAALQRLTGMGFALVVGPFVVLLLGPLPGVLLVNVCGALSSLVICWRLRRGIDWRRYALLAPPALVGVALGALVLDELPTAGTEVVVGALVVLGMTVSLLAGRAPSAQGPGAGITAGLLSGAMSVAAGTGGPAVAVYAVASRWDPRSFAATIQPYFVTVASASVVAKLLLTPAALPSLPTTVWVLLGAACLVGIVAGDRLAPYLSVRTMRTVLVVLAYVGGTATLVRGLTGL